MQQPWPPGIATERIRALARSDDFDLAYTRHALDRMRQRNLLVGDILHVLKHGFVYDDPQPATEENHYIYRMEAQTPNSGRRSVRVVVIPDEAASSCKLITVMWADEG